MNVNDGLQLFIRFIHSFDHSRRAHPGLLQGTLIIQLCVTQPPEVWNQWLTLVEDVYYSANRKNPILLKIVGEVHPFRFSTPLIDMWQVWNVLTGHNSDVIRNDSSSTGEIQTS
jgi:hypothetical protein